MRCAPPRARSSSPAPNRRSCGSASGERPARWMRRYATAIAWRSTAPSRPTPRKCGARAPASSLRLDLEAGLDPVRTLLDDAVEADVVGRDAPLDGEGVVGAEIA